MYSEILSARNIHNVIVHHCLYALPVAAYAISLAKGIEGLWMFLSWLWFAMLALTMNHRFFSHIAFKTSRPFRFLLALVSCLGLQHGPLWWSGKHRKHHKLCDVPGDPHSWKQSSFMHSWVGWMMSVEERQIDVAYLHPALLDDEPLFHLPKFLTPLMGFGFHGETDGAVKGGERVQRPASANGQGKVVATELLLVDRLWFLPFLSVALGLYYGAGCSARSVFIFYVAPSMQIPLPILLFNVMFHPPNHPTKGKDEEGCFALDSLLDPLAVIFGEAAHEDHHVFPARARRPSPLGIDVSWYAIIKPLMFAGLIWDPVFYKTGDTTKAKPKGKAA
jgi:fatty-acid desaturase